MAILKLNLNTCRTPDPDRHSLMEDLSISGLCLQNGHATERACLWPLCVFQGVVDQGKADLLTTLLQIKDLTVSPHAEFG